MKNKQIQEFFTKVAQDESFKQEVLKLKAEMEAKKLSGEDGKQFISKVVLPKAKELGYSFKLEDLAEFFNSQEGAELASLSPEDLENVSGGVSTFVIGALALLGWLGFVSHGNNVAQRNHSDIIVSSSSVDATSDKSVLSEVNKDEGQEAVDNIGDVITKLKSVGLDYNKLSQEKLTEMRAKVDQIYGQIHTELFQYEKDGLPRCEPNQYIKGVDGKVLYGSFGANPSEKAEKQARALYVIESLWCGSNSDVVMRTVLDDYWDEWADERLRDIHSWRDCVSKVCTLVDRQSKGETLSTEDAERLRLMVECLKLAQTEDGWHCSVIKNTHGTVYYGEKDDYKREGKLLWGLTSKANILTGKEGDVREYVTMVKTRLSSSYEELVEMGKQRASKPATQWSFRNWF